MTIWNILWPFGKIYGRLVCGHLLYFSQFGMLGPRKIWQPWSQFAPPTGQESIIARNPLHSADICTIFARGIAITLDS
jgi:hypothetical protein